MNRHHAYGICLPRRRFVQGLLLGGGAAALGLSSNRVSAQTMPLQQELSGVFFDLTIGEMPVNFTGHKRIATAVNGQLPAPLLRWKQGDTISLRVRNTLPVTSSIHWHGIVLPADMDGVPGLSFAGIPPGGEYRYRFVVNQSGTYWYHSHSRFQEATGLYGPIVIAPHAGERHPTERDYVVMLNDWSDTDPERIYANLKKQSDYYDRGKLTAGDFLRDARQRGVRAAWAERSPWQRMRMDSRDLVDVSGMTYTYLMNGRPPAANWTGLFNPGERVRLRFINGSAMSFFDIRLPGLRMTVVAADGQDIEPVSVDEFRLGTAETCDVIVSPPGDRAWTIFAQSLDRSGYACGTLAPRRGMLGERPALDPRARLSLRDMMGAMSNRPGTAAGMAGMDKLAMAGMRPAMSQTSPSLQTGVEVDMRVPMPRRNLDDPGVGLRDNGRRVLSYADMRTIDAPISPQVKREIVLRLTGNMQRYLWSFDGTRFSAAPPVRLKRGEPVRITLINDTMMIHPIHLHGMWSELEDEQGRFQLRKHTVMVQPAQQISYRVSADAPGRWAYHCHLLYHMEAGMFREVDVA